MGNASDMDEDPAMRGRPALTQEYDRSSQKLESKDGRYLSRAQQNRRRDEKESGRDMYVLKLPRAPSLFALVGLRTWWGLCLFPGLLAFNHWAGVFKVTEEQA